MTISKKRYRIGAFLIDFFIYWLITITISVFYGVPDREGGYSFEGLPALTLFTIGFFLWPLSESFWGQTIGKRVFDLKVLDEDLKPIGIGAALFRFFLGILDYMFLIGLVVAARSKRNQRLGDKVAKTIVVRIKD